ncbi:RNA polymerase sigma factor [Niallia sp. Sow4_A1]|uniref:RNA polymerase sigma factor n=1 Tax=Niallia hominis TaxID=3133173 RepID=A0ABV1F1U1_9BACI|nr:MULTISPECIES: RNA polymerase sigma factor [Bacillaceae]MCF2649869.1 RNA polymerase sigma factor [Niallia circulans]MCM3364777.1 RNA polymerase sigma factor [Niallia sp. MER TA 168]CAI9393599.1 ECF RNA polymerase sigma factor SigW [Bacillus sp. T2.9-1]
MNKEQEIIEKILLGDIEKFNVLLEPYLKISYQTAFLLLKDYSLAEDAVQEALFATFKSLKKYNPQKALFKTWFNKILINTTLKLQRKRFFFMNFMDYNFKETTIIPESIYLQKEESEIIMKAIEKLDFKHQIIVILFYFQDLSIKEISQLLNIKEGTIKSRLYYSKQRLKSLLENKEVFPDERKGKKNIT